MMTQTADIFALFEELVVRRQLARRAGRPGPHHVEMNPGAFADLRESVDAASGSLLIGSHLSRARPRRMEIAGVPVIERPDTWPAVVIYDSPIFWELHEVRVALSGVRLIRLMGTVTKGPDRHRVSLSVAVPEADPRAARRALQRNQESIRHVLAWWLATHSLGKAA